MSGDQRRRCQPLCLVGHRIVALLFLRWLADEEGPLALGGAPAHPAAQRQDDALAPLHRIACRHAVRKARAHPRIDQPRGQSLHQHQVLVFFEHDAHGMPRHMRLDLDFARQLAALAHGVRDQRHARAHHLVRYPRRFTVQHDLLGVFAQPHLPHDVGGHHPRIREGVLDLCHAPIGNAVAVRHGAGLLRQRLAQHVERLVDARILPVDHRLGGDRLVRGMRNFELWQQQPGARLADREDHRTFRSVVRKARRVDDVVV